MKSLTLDAPGKLNLTLNVCWKRNDGYHNLSMLMQTVSLADTVTVTLADEWRCECDDPAIPQGEENLCTKAARAFYARLGREIPTAISIQKRIPVGGGMAGGSADAAAVLRALNTLFDAPFSRQTLSQIGAEVGSDVPFCVYGGTALVELRGELVTPMPKLHGCTFALAKPDFSISTPEAFRALDAEASYPRPDAMKAVNAISWNDFDALGRETGNSFEPMMERKYPIIAELRARMTEYGAFAAHLTGSGSVVFGMFRSRFDADLAARAIQKDGVETFLAIPVYY